MFDGNHLRNFRTRYHLTQEDVATYTRVLPREVRRWEANDVAMPMHRRLLLARLMFDMVRQAGSRKYEPCYVCLGAGRIPVNDRVNDRGTCQG